VRRQPRQERSIKRVEQILDAAARLVDAEGPAAVTTNAIAKEADLPIGTLYQFFPNKHDLFNALLTRQLDALDARFEPFIVRAAEADELAPLVDDLIEGAIDTLAEAYLTLPGLASLMRAMRGTPEGQSAVSLNNARIGALLSGVLATRVATGRAEAMAQMLVEATDGVLQHWLAEKDPADRATLDELKAMIAAFLKAQLLGSQT
jgi:AcrR family transcriptional regulator